LVIGGEQEKRKEEEKGGIQERKKARQERAKQNASVRKCHSAPGKRSEEVDEGTREEEPRRKKKGEEEMKESDEKEPQKEFVLLFGTSLDPWNDKAACRQSRYRGRKWGVGKGADRIENKQFAGSVAKGLLCIG